MKKKLIIKLLILLLIIIVPQIYSLIEARMLKVTRITITDNDIPANFDGKTIIFCADIHHGPYFSRKRVSQLAELINSYKPDFVLYGGDFVHRSLDYINPVFQELSKAKGTYFTGGVLGNHDNWESQEISIKAMEVNAITFLDNRSQEVFIGDQSIIVGGVGDYFSDIQIEENTTESRENSDFIILLSHNPDYFDHINTDLIDLTLSGHTHGGQITFFGLWAPLLPVINRSHWRGLYEKDGSKLFITTGVGTITPPMRFFAQPEIVLITLRSE